jgi:hypothetical protein
MKFIFIIIILFFGISNLFGQDCKFRTTEISIPLKSNNGIKEKKNLCVYEFDTVYEIRFRTKRYKIINNIYSDKIILINVKRLKDFKSVNQILYFRLDTNNLTFDKVINFADSIKYDTAKKRYWLYLKKIPQITFTYNDENLFFDNEVKLGEIEIKNNSKLFTMIEKDEIIPNYIMGVVYIFRIKLKE